MTPNPAACLLLPLHLVSKPGRKLRNRQGRQQGCKWLRERQTRTCSPPTHLEPPGVMATNDKLPINDSLEGTDTNSGVPSVCLEGRVTNQTRPTPGAAIPGEPTKTDRNYPSDADTPRSAQSTRLGTNNTATESHAGELDALRSLRNHIRTDFKKILANSDRLLICASPTIPKLEANLNNLLESRNDLIELYSNIFDLIEDEIEREVDEADRYTLCFFRANAYPNHRIQCLNKKQPLERKSTCFSDMAVFNETPREHLYSLTESPSNAVKGDDENIPSNVELLGITQTAPVKLNLTRALEETGIEPLSGEFVYIFVPDFMQAESFPEVPEPWLDPIIDVWEVAPVHQYEPLYLIEVGKREPRLLITADQLEEIAKPDRENVKPHLAMNIITEITSSELEYIEKKTGAPIGTQETVGRTSFNSGHKNYSQIANPLKVVRDRHQYFFRTDAGHTLWFCGTARWRRSAILRLRRRLRHRRKIKVQVE